ncbi:cytochrome P450 [Nesterenkonia xinjiangensis]|uniref:Cytochrome P450 n=1 Tax=Nesterenkonia xinjiangensis TaxID=225327 RepID=A0A7Z0GNI3_9MICC|nr:cytochrome P450 [Nesterenkonia xinjiangensis]NYJ78163.1 cytochrome P450 [Nesterenkonia xinjiangensis]
MTQQTPAPGHQTRARTHPAPSMPNSVQNPLPRATRAETALILRDVLAPMAAKGPIVRRPGVVAAVERLDLEARAVRRVQALSEKYGRGPLLVPLPGRPLALVLDPDHVHRILDQTPEPFAAAETLKRRALQHFQPGVSLISHGGDRAVRRHLNEMVLDPDHPVHRMAEVFLPVVHEETDQMLAEIDGDGGALDWERFSRTWFRIVRRLVMGDSAREDEDFTALLDDLRQRGNLAFLRPVDEEAREEFLSRIQDALDRAEPGSLAAVMSEVHAQGAPGEFDADGGKPAHQVPQWLFAFDPAGMATFRALALLASHPARLRTARIQLEDESGEDAPTLELLRATVLEALRLWPTTPLILRETTMEVEFEHGIMPAGVSVLIFAPFFHRDERRLDFAHRFAPEIWEERMSQSGQHEPQHEVRRDGQREDSPAQGEWPLMPFSLGTGICPGRQLVLLITSSMLARVLEGHEVDLLSHSLGREKELPSLLDPYALEFRLTER